MTMTGQQNGARSKSLAPSLTNSRSYPEATAQPARRGSSAAYCGCPRTGDLWRCPVGGTSECAPGGGGCALYATTQATGRETWDRAAEDALDGRPCPCGEADR